MIPLSGVALSCMLALAPSLAGAQYSHVTARRPVRPSAAELPEFTAKPVDPPPKLSPTLRRLAQSKVLQQAKPDEPSTLPPAIDALSSLIHDDPTNAELYFLRAQFACYSGANPASIVEDLSNSLVSRSSTDSPLSTRRERLVLRAKIEFTTGKLLHAMNDLDAAIAEDFETAQKIFDDGTTKISTVTRPCVWTLPDLDELARQFPTDFRPSLYHGLYFAYFLSFDLGSDFKPALESFTRAAELNPHSPLPHFFTGELYTVGRLGGLFSTANARCLDFIQPRTEPCLALDETRKTGIRALTRAIAADPTLMPAYALRAAALYDVKEFRQALRDYDRALSSVLTHDQARTLYNDRALARIGLRDYRGAISDLDHAIALGCDETCTSYENRADAYLKIHDYAHAIDDISRSINKVLKHAVFLMNIEQFRQIYPEFDDTPDDRLAEKLRILFFPAFSHDDFVQEFVKEKRYASTVLPDLYIRRGDAYAALGQLAKANREYDRVSRAFPDWAAVSFTTINGKRTRARE